MDKVLTQTATRHFLHIGFTYDSSTVHVSQCSPSIWFSSTHEATSSAGTSPRTRETAWQRSSPPVVGVDCALA